MLYKIIFLFYVSLSQFQASDDTMLQANQAYESGDYPTAIGLYESLLTEGIRDAAVYFNLGNAYYEGGQIGWAMVNYRRAQAISPRDAAVGANLALVRAQRVDVQIGEAVWIDRLATATSSIMTLSEVAWLVFALWVCWFGLSITWLARPIWRRLLEPIVGVGICLLIGLFFLTSRIYVTEYRPGAVVVDLSAQVMSGPGDDYLPIFNIYAAAEVRLLEVRGEWVRFVLPDGRQGWIHRASVAKID
jgi:tetratricopeptide (TPR) repeat protein